MATMLSIEFTDVDCKIVLAERGKGGRITVRTMNSFELPKEENTDTRIAQRAQLLRDALKSAKIKPQKVRVVIPKNFVMARSVNLPSVDENEIVGMARFEAERHIPFNADRHIVSHHTLVKSGVAGSNVLLAAVDQPIAQEYLEVCVKAGLKVEAISVSSLAAFNSFVAAEPTALADRVVAVVNIGRAATDLVIATNGIVNFTRGSTLGLNKLLTELAASAPEKNVTLTDLHNIDALEPHLYFRTGAPSSPPVATYDELPSSFVVSSIPGLDELNAANQPPKPLTNTSPNVAIVPPSEAVAPENKGAAAFRGWLMRVLQEVKRTYEFAHREFDIPLIDHIYICGEGTAIHNISQYFRINFSVEASIFDPLRGTQVAKKLPEDLRARSAAFAAPIGALVADSAPFAIRVNLLPLEYVHQRQAKRQQRSYITTGILLLIALAMGYLYMANVFEQKRQMLSELIDVNTKDKKRVTDLENKKQRLEIIRSNVQEDQGALDVMEKLSELPFVGSKVTFLRFEYKKGDYVKLAYHAKDVPSANQLLAELRKMQTPQGKLYFEDPKFDDNALTMRQPRGRGTETVYEVSVTAPFPKKKKKTTRSTDTEQTQNTDAAEGGNNGGNQ